MPTEQNRKKQLDAWRVGQAKEAVAQRMLCSHLMFWKSCGHKKCLRTRACVADGKDCFDRFWPLLPEEVKIITRAEIKAAKAGLSDEETMAEIDRELDRWRETMTPRAAPQAAPQPAPQSPPVARAAPSSCASGPRLRVL